MVNKKSVGFAFLLLCVLLLCALPIRARAWQVRSSMSLAEIQDVFDRAGDNDKVMFHKGVYDFSAGPFIDLYTDGAAVVIRDKSLSVKGVGEVLIRGRQSDLNSSGEAIRGISAFLVSNPAHDKDVSFSNLKFETFMFAIIVTNTQSTTPLAYQPCARDIDVSHCVFSDMQRNAVALTNVAGNITIRDNRMAAVRFPIFISWYWTDGHLGCQTDGTILDISNNQLQGGRGGIILQNVNHIVIAGNDITGMGNYRLYAIYIEALKTAGLIRDNRIDNFRCGIELLAGWVNDPLYPSFEEKVTQAEVTGNEMTRIFSTGVLVAGGLVRDCRITGNRISLSPWGFAGIYSDGYANRFEANVIEGTGAYAVGLFGADYSASGGQAYYAHDEFFANNSVAGFTPDNVHYYLDFNTHDNHVHGICAENATVIDNGSNNEVTCLFAPGGSRRAAAAAGKSGDREKLER